MAPATRNYLTVTASYWGFTLTDGALRMLVLLHFFKLGYSPFTLAFLFLLYEFAGIVANLSGGWLATRFGIPRMLAVGQALQIAGVALLSALDPGWTQAASVAWAAAARIFMFGAGEVWFVVGLPVFLSAAGWRFVEVGGFLAAWTIGYGIIQASAPGLVARSPDGLSREVPTARLWAGLLAAVPLALALLLRDQDLWRPDLVVVAGLALFGLPFAVNSSLHSYLILAYAGSEKAAEDVGFYYAANATGRLIGILLSGALYQAGGMPACLVGSAAMLIVCWSITFLLPVAAGPLHPASAS